MVPSSADNREWNAAGKAGRAAIFMRCVRSCGSVHHVTSGVDHFAGYSDGMESLVWPDWLRNLAALERGRPLG